MLLARMKCTPLRLLSQCTASIPKIRAADKPRKQEKPRSVTLRGTAQWPLCFSRRFSWRRANWRSASASRSFRETFFRASFPCSR